MAKSIQALARARGALNAEREIRGAGEESTDRGEGSPGALPFVTRLSYVAPDEKQAREAPRAALTWIRDLNGLRRTLKGGSEIYMDLDHWRRTRPEAPPSYESELKNTAYFGTPDQMTGWKYALLSFWDQPLTGHRPG